MALLGADVDDWMESVLATIIATDYFNSVTLIDVRYVTPTLDELAVFDAMLVWSNYPFENAADLGDNLADYVDAGGGVVERVDFNQADWADARVELSNGQTVWLGDFPTAPLRSAYSSDLPFSFSYGGRPASELLGTWKHTTSTRGIDEQGTERTHLWQDPATGLQVRCVGMEYHDFPVVEWKLFFKNTGDQPTPVIDNVLPLDADFERHNEGEFLLHHSNGSPHSLVKMSDPTDYAPRTTPLKSQQVFELGAKLGPVSYTHLTLPTKA